MSNILQHIGDLFRSAPPPDRPPQRLAEAQAATQRAVEASERLQRKLEEDPLEKFTADLRGGKRRRKSGAG